MSKLGEHYFPANPLERHVRVYPSRLGVVELTESDIDAEITALKKAKRHIAERAECCGAEPRAGSVFRGLGRWFVRCF